MGLIQSKIGMGGEVSFRVIRGTDHPHTQWPVADNVRTIMKYSMPQNGLSDEVNAYRKSNLRNIWRGLKKIAVAEKLGIPTFWGNLYATVIRGNGQVIDLGLISTRVVTNAGVGYIVDAFQNSTELENMKYHGFGEDNTAESASDTALGSELSSEYPTNSTRPTGTTTEGATANVYRSVATLSPDEDVAITEHGIFSQASTAGGVLLDRSVFSAINLIGNSDSLQVTYDLTLTAGS